MTKFKIGDKVKFNPKLFKAGAKEFDKGFKSEGVITIFPPYETMHVDGICVFKAAFELIVPTGFEVGKKYVFCGQQELKEIPEVIYTIEYRMSNGKWAYTINKGRAGYHNDKDFEVFKEYIPPPPEEWRIVYKDKFGNVTVGNIPFKSESEANASQFWTDHSTAFKTIRVDA